MVNNDNLANAFSNILNCEKVGKTECIVKPATKLFEKILVLMKKEGYIKNYTLIEEGKGNSFKIELEGKINKCGVVKPRFSVTIEEFDKFERRFLPAKDFGILLISTSRGLITHSEAKEKNIGGKLIAFIY